MANARDKAENAIMKDYAVSTAVDRGVLDRGSEQLDKALYNAECLDSYLNDQVFLKKTLLSLLKQANSNGITPELHKQITEVQAALKKSKAPDALEQTQVKTQDINLSYEEQRKSNYDFAKEMNIDISNPYLSALSNIDRNILAHEFAEKFDLLRLDKYDYAFATAVGLLCGAIDALLVGTASKEKGNMGLLAQKTDDFYDALVMKYAKMKGWNGPKITSNGKKSDPLKSAINYLEREFPVGYDQRTIADVCGEVPGITPLTHHLLSLGHSPIGLIFSVLDLLQNKASFINSETGKIIRIPAKWSKGAVAQNKNEIKSVSEAIERWFSHLMSDVAGASGSSGRGAGVPTGFETILQSFNFGKIPLENNSYGTISDAVREMYKNGFDFRFQTATALPVILNEVLIRLYWFFKQHFYYGKTIKESLPFGRDRELQRMLLISTLAFSTVDVTHAIVKGYMEQNPVTLLNSLNYIGLADFGYKLFVNFRLEHEHNEKLKKLMQEEIKVKHEQLMNADYLLK